MKKLFLLSLISLNLFSNNYYLINYKGKNYKAYENKNNLYTTIELDSYKMSILNRYVQKYKIIRRLNNEEIRIFKCSPVYNDCK
nr:MAG TPA: hypothetical protein [Herelleviridae sp.]